MKTITLFLTLFTTVFFNNHVTLAQKHEKIDYTIIENRYFAHNSINEVSHFTFSTLEEFQSKVGFACYGDCSQDAKRALKEDDFQKNIVFAIVYPDVNPNAKISIKEVLLKDDKQQTVVNYTFEAPSEKASFSINAIRIFSLPKKYAQNVEFVRID